MSFLRLQQGARAALAAQARADGQTINQMWGQLTAAEEQIAVQHFLWGLQDPLPEEGDPLRILLHQLMPTQAGQTQMWTWRSGRTSQSLRRLSCNKPNRTWTAVMTA